MYGRLTQSEHQCGCFANHSRVIGQPSSSPGMHRPDVHEEHAEVSYSLPGTSTGLSVKDFSVAPQSPEKWVKYEILYHYRVQMFPDLSID